MSIPSVINYSNLPDASLNNDVIYNVEETFEGKFKGKYISNGTEWVPAISQTDDLTTRIYLLEKDVNLIDVSGKVDKESGKGLSEENYTSDEKEKLGDLPSASSLSSSLSGKASTVHGHVVSDITGFNTAVDARIENIIGSAPANLDTLEELAAALGDDENFASTVTAALAGKAPTSHTHAQSDITGLVSSLSALSNRITTLENKTLPKHIDVYTGTTDANGDVTITFANGKYTTAPALFVSYVFNNNNYGTFYNLKSISNSSALIRVHRNKNTSVGALGGDVDPDEPLASTSIKVVAIEF